MNFGDWSCFPCWFTIEIFHRSRMVTAACSMWCSTVYRPPCLSTEPKPPPQDKTRAKSFPVPAGRIATGGGETKFCFSIAFKTQPTVPSPPHTRILKCGTFLNKYRPTSGPCVELSSKTCITIRKNAFKYTKLKGRARIFSFLLWFKLLSPRFIAKVPLLKY